MSGHSERGHALLSASGSSRWMNCTPSARLEEKIPEQTSSYAREGTLAHEMAELKLLKALDRIIGKVYVAEVKKIESEVLKDFGADALMEMHNETEKFQIQVMEVYNMALALDKMAEIHLEIKLDYSHLVPEGFGTLDVGIVCLGTLIIIDLKYGKGVKVFAPGNSQLRIYALAALEQFDMVFGIEQVKTMIIQPRLDHESIEEISVSDLIDWSTKELAPAAQMAFKGEGEKKAGDWCKFCKVKVLCPAMKDLVMEAAKQDFASPELLEIEEIIGVYGMADLIKDWISSVESYLLEKALAGDKIEGYKLVEGKSQRRISDPEGALESLKKKKYKVGDITKVSIQGIGHLEKLLGKEKFEELVAPFVTKPPGKLALVPESDSRPGVGVQQAKEDFKD